MLGSLIKDEKHNAIGMISNVQHRLGTTLFYGNIETKDEIMDMTITDVGLLYDPTQSKNAVQIILTGKANDKN